MAIDYVMPKLAMGMNEGTINEWLVKEGEHVEKGATILVMETEKVAYDLESPESGFFHIIGQPGDTVPVETVIAQFAESAEECAELANNDAPATETSAAPSAASAQPAPTQSVATDTELAPAVAEYMPHLTAPDTSVSSGGRIKASPLAKKLAGDANLDLKRVTGTGPGGRIVKRDVLQANQAGQAGAVTSAAALPTAALIEKLRIPTKGVTRGTIARRMVDSLQVSAQVSSVWDSDITRLLAARQRLVAMEEQLGVRVSMNALLIKALVCALKEVPIANAALVGDDIVVYENINVGIAIALPGETDYDSKLMVPVLKHADRMGVVDIDKGMKALIEKARNGQLVAEDMMDSTVTFSSTAGLGPPGMKGTPILNLPNALLIGPATPVEKPVVHDGEIKIRTMMPISMTFDHRVLDGKPVSIMAKHLHDCIENPELMLA